MATPPPGFGTPIDELKKEFETSKREVADLSTRMAELTEAVLSIQTNFNNFFQQSKSSTANQPSHQQQIKLLSQVT